MINSKDLDKLIRQSEQVTRALRKIQKRLIAGEKWEEERWEGLGVPEIPREYTLEMNIPTIAPRKKKLKIKRHPYKSK